MGKYHQRDPSLIEIKSKVKLGFFFLHKLLQIKVCRAFTDMKYKNNFYERESFKLENKKINIVPKIESDNFRKKIYKNLFKIVDDKFEKKVKLGFLKLKINRLRRNRKMINKMNPYLTLSITLRQIIHSKMKESLRTLKAPFMTKISKINESSILPILPQFSDQIEIISDISIPSVINAINKAQQNQLNMTNKDDILTKEAFSNNLTTEISITGMRNSHDNCYNTLSLNLLYKTKTARSSNLNHEEKARRFNKGLVTIKNIFQKKKFNCLM